MKTVTKPVYYCDHCKKRGFVKKLIEQHENICWGNPATRPACADCIHLTRDGLDFYNGSTGETRTSSIKAPYCQKLKKYLHTQSAVLRGYPEKHPEHYEDSTLMPMKCEWQEQHAALEADTFL